MGHELSEPGTGDQAGGSRGTGRGQKPGNPEHRGRSRAKKGAGGWFGAEKEV